MEAWRMPSHADFYDKAQSWGKGLVDVAFIATTAFKGGQVASNLSKASRVARVGTTAEKIMLPELVREGVRFQGTQWRFPKNPNDLLKGLARDSKGRIYTSDNLRIRPEQHPIKPGEIFNPRHHGQHYYVETRHNPNVSWRRNDNIEILKPSGYTPGSSIGFLPDELFPGI